MAPPAIAARSTVSHSGRLSAMIATRSPAAMPSAVRPSEVSRMPSKNSLPLTLRTTPPRALPTTGAVWNRPITWNGRSAMVRTSGSIVGRAAALLDQPDVRDHHPLVDRLHHVVDRQRRDRDRGQRFHLDSGLRGGTSPAGDLIAVLQPPQSHVDVRQRQ